MKTFSAICLKDYEIVDRDKTMTIKRGKEYTVSVPDEHNEVTVFSHCWASGIPADIFGGLVPGPGESHKKESEG